MRPILNLKAPKMPKAPAAAVPKTVKPPALADHRPPTNHDDFHALGVPKNGKY